MEPVQSNDPTPSVKGHFWQPAETESRRALTIQQRYDLPELMARLLSTKDIELEDVETYLNPTIKDYLPDPSHLLDMDKAAKLLADAVEQQQKVVVFGDYDVDGATSSAILIRFFKGVGLEIGYYIPDRIDEGYGPNTEALLKIREQGADLVVTVDCGAVAFEPFEAAAKAGLGVIVIDHHLGAETLPESLAVVNPNRVDETSECKHLAAAGLSFLLIVAVNRELRERGWYQTRQTPDLMQWLDMVALGTVCDVMKLTTLNRAYVAQGLKVMARRRNIGLNALADVARLENAPDVYALGFMLGPRVNAGGRVGQADLGVRLLTTSDPEEAKEIAEKLDMHNKERRAIEQTILDQALEMAEKQSNAPAVIVAMDDWHPGVIGIVASRLKDAHDKPAIVIGFDGEVGKGSARSVPGFDLGSAITDARLKGLIEAGGGHAAAAGLSLAPNQLEAFTQHIYEAAESAAIEAVSVRYYDVALSIGGLSLVTLDALEQLGPFGMGNPEPRFAVENIHIVKPQIRGEQHIACIITDKKGAQNVKGGCKAIAFRAMGSELEAPLLTRSSEPITLIGRLKRSRWQGREWPEFHIEDMIL